MGDGEDVCTSLVIADFVTVVFEFVVDVFEFVVSVSKTSGLVVS